MKKTGLILVCVLLTIPVFAADSSPSLSLSAGGGGLLGYTFTRYTLEGGDITSSQNMDRLDYAGFLFFDATYVEFAVMFKGGANTYEEDIIFSNTAFPNSKGTGNETSLGFSLLGKYPFMINPRTIWFPLFGVEYQIALMQRRTPDGDIKVTYDRSKGSVMTDRDKDEKPYPLSAWNSLWINVGAGLDFIITGPLFLRSELLFGFRLPTSYEMGALEVVKNPPMNVTDPKLAGLTGSPTLKIALGYRFR